MAKQELWTELVKAQKEYFEAEDELEKKKRELEIVEDRYFALRI